MDFDVYQQKASQTDQYPGEGKREESISLFGLIGEIGSVLTTFKKRLRDKRAYKTFHADLREELGDVLWYLANLATKYQLSLNDIATDNLDKTQLYWGNTYNFDSDYLLYDDSFPKHEQLPRSLRVQFDERGISEAGFNKVHISVDGTQVGDPLTDNAYGDDGYRYHDCFHLAYAAILGWSPVLRRMTGCKRKSCNETDEIQDGARASFTEEFISLYTYNYARDHNFLDGTEHVDSDMLRTILSLVSGLEVETRTASEWRLTIVNSFEVFRQLTKNKGGIVEINLIERTIIYREKHHNV